MSPTPEQLERFGNYALGRITDSGELDFLHQTGPLSDRWSAGEVTKPETILLPTEANLSEDGTQSA